MIFPLKAKLIELFRDVMAIQLVCCLGRGGRGERCVGGGKVSTRVTCNSTWSDSWHSVQLERT